MVGLYSLYYCYRFFLDIGPRLTHVNRFLVEQLTHHNSENTTCLWLLGWAGHNTLIIFYPVILLG
jgi:hypothetical protein